MMLKTAVQPQSLESSNSKGRKYAHDDVTYHIKSTTSVDKTNIDAPNNKTRFSYRNRNLTIYSYKDMKRNCHRTRRGQLTKW